VKPPNPLRSLERERLSLLPSDLNTQLCAGHDPASSFFDREVQHRFLETVNEVI
jgi:hypothetical protein